MFTKEIILEKIQNLITNHFQTPEEAFAFFDKDSNAKLSRMELVTLLKQADLSDAMTGIISKRLMDDYDKDGDGLMDWREFKMAINEIE
jgi:Ca2+-binding EF-hand superfamily protein